MRGIRPLIPLPCIVLFGLLAQVRAADWPTIPPQELAMTDDPANPGAAAILLYREVSNDDAKGLQTEYRRIKVLNDEGKKFADIEIPYVDRVVKIEDIQARTVRPDGTAVNFQGQIFDRTVVKARKTRVQVKAFTLPEVQKGSIVEYSYTIRRREKPLDLMKNPYALIETMAVPSATWIVQDDLFTRHARFSVRPFPTAHLEWILKSASKDYRPQTQPDGTVVLEAENIPAFQIEELMPPEEWVKSRVSFFYSLGPMSSVYWEHLGEMRAKALMSFLGDPKKLQKAVAGMVSPSDSPEIKLRKIYARVQQIRSLSFEPSKTEQEAKHENLKRNESVEDVLKRNYAYANEINLSMVALTRAAGFESAPVLLMSRDTGFLTTEDPDPDQLDAMVVWTSAGGKEYVLDPATRYCPFDLLPWAETAVVGIALPWAEIDASGSVRVHKPVLKTDQASSFLTAVKTPTPASAMAVVRRNASLQLNSEGGVDGSIAIDYVGQEALERRIAARNMDENARKQFLEKEAKDWVAGTAKVELKGSVNWEQADQPLRANFSVTVPDYVASTGRRLLFRAGFFESKAKTFQSATRIHDIYFAYPFEEADDINWKLPPGFQVGGLPEKKETRSDLGGYELSVVKTDGGLHSSRHFAVQAIYLPLSSYLRVRTHFNLMRLGDDGQVVLESTGALDASKAN